MSLQPGTRLGPYEIVAPIGTGSIGEVYNTGNTPFERMVAIKILQTHWPPICSSAVVLFGPAPQG